MAPKATIGGDPSIDFYEILGVDETATPCEINAAFRRKAMKFHPDKNPGNPRAWECFLKIREAHSVLGDEPRRQSYDSLRRKTKRYGSLAYRTWRRGPERNVAQSERESGRRNRGEIRIGLEEAERGCRREVLWNGVPRTVDISPGVVDGQFLRFQRGTEGPFARQQYLFLEVRVQGDLGFRCIGLNMVCTLHVDLHAALLGGTRLIRLPNGKLLQVRIPPLSGEQSQFRLKGMGVISSSSPGHSGDLIVTLMVLFPRRLRQEEQAIFNLLTRVRKAKRPNGGL